MAGGFSLAGYLIMKSYLDWQASPVATTTTTHPIQNLILPTVTVCPPDSASFALNHDLLKAGNGSLTDQERESLKEKAVAVILGVAHKEFANRMVASVNPENMELLAQGFISTPKPYVADGLEVLVSTLDGTIETPWFGKSFNRSYFLKDRYHHVVLEFPEDLEKELDEGSLVIELEVDTREEEGWQETVEVTEGPRYLQSQGERSWAAARQHCVEWGGDLASVHSEWEHQEINRIRSKKTGKPDHHLWLGGTTQDKRLWTKGVCGGSCWGTPGAWQWTDESPWDFSRWQDGIEGTETGRCTSKQSNIALVLG